MKSTVKLMVLGAALFLSSCGKSIPDRLQESTVLVKTRHGDKSGHGTAFFVRGKSGVCTVVTAAHVVLGKEVVRLQTRDGREREPLQIMPFDRDLDLAAVTFSPREGSRCPYRPLELGNSETVEELDDIIISGFPGRSDGEPVRQTIPTTVTGFGSLPQGYSISYKGDLYGGMSGGPVLDRWGKVVAVHGLSDRRLLELYDARRQASLPPEELAMVRQAEQRLRSGVFLNTFKWGIPINLYVRYRPAMVVPDGAGLSSTFAWLLFGSGAVAGGLLVYFGVKPLTPTAEAEGRRRREAEANARSLQGQVRNLEKRLAEEAKQRQQAEAAAQRERDKAKRGKEAGANLGRLQNQVQALESQLAEARRQHQEEAKKRQQVEGSAQRLLEQVQALQGGQAKTPTRQAAAPREEVELKSAKGVDYSKLRDLLAAKDWKGADGETWSVMLRAATREKEGWLDVEDIDNFPCEDLRTIDQLWLKYSDGRFGFSVQKDIYHELGGTRKYDLKIWEAFGDRVGWRQGGNWLSYSKLNWGKESTVVAPPGHLPYGGCLGWYSGVGLWPSILSRKDL